MILRTNGNGPLEQPVTFAGFSTASAYTLVLPVKLTPQDRALGVTLASATLTVAPDFGADPIDHLIEKGITPVASVSQGQITDTAAADGLGSLSFVLTLSDMAALAEKRVFWTTVTDSLGRATAFARGVLVSQESLTAPGSSPFGTLQTYIDTVVAALLAIEAAARVSGDSSTLTSAQSYADAKDALLSAAVELERAAGAVLTLEQANQYADAVVVGLLAQAAAAAALQVASEATSRASADLLLSDRLTEAEGDIDTLYLGQGTGLVARTTYALLAASLAFAADTPGLVTNDPTPALNGTYIKLGASGVGSWQIATDRVTGLEQDVAAIEASGALEITDTLSRNGAQIYDGAGTLLPIYTDRAGRVLLGFDTTTKKFVGLGIFIDADVEEVIGGKRQVEYSGGGPVYPLLTDRAGKVLLGYNDVTAMVVGAGLVTLDDVLATLGDYRLQSFSGSGDVTPLLTDRAGRVLLGFDADAGTLIGAFPASGGTTTTPVVSADMVPLAAADVPVHKAVNHFLYYGQSLCLGAASGGAISLTQPYSNITFAGGPRAYLNDYSSFIPLVEDNRVPAVDGGTDRGETPCSATANYATTLRAIDGDATASHVVLASTAGKGSTRVQDLQPASTWYAQSVLYHIQGAFDLNPDYALHCVGWVQGERDARDDEQTTFANYTTRLTALRNSIQADTLAITGQTKPVFLLTYQTTWNVANWNDVARAQLGLAQTNSLFFLTTPCYHLPFAADAIHLTAIGYKWLGAYFGRAYKRLVIDNVEPRWLNPLTATNHGTELRVRFDVPVGPLVLDIIELAATADYGFRVVDSLGTVDIDTVAVSGADVLITLATAPVGATTVRYALDYLGTGLIVTGGASGNLRDSAPDSITVSGQVCPLYNVCPHFEMSVVALGE